jgi:hypothetical protein
MFFWKKKLSNYGHARDSLPKWYLARKNFNGFFSNLLNWFLELNWNEWLLWPAQIYWGFLRAFLEFNRHLAGWEIWKKKIRDAPEPHYMVLFQLFCSPWGNFIILFTNLLTIQFIGWVLFYSNLPIIISPPSDPIYL